MAGRGVGWHIRSIRHHVRLGHRFLGDLCPRDLRKDLGAGISNCHAGAAGVQPPQPLRLKKEYKYRSCGVAVGAQGLNQFGSGHQQILNFADTARWLAANLRKLAVDLLETPTL